MPDLMPASPVRRAPSRPAVRAVVGGCWLVAAVLGPLAWTATALSSGEPWWHPVVSAIVLVSPATVGALLAVRMPRNPVGWLLLIMALSAAVAQVAQWGAERAGSGWVVWAAWLGAVTWAFGPPLLPLLGLVFPDGRPVGRIGRWGVRAGIGGVGLVAVLSALSPGPLAGLSDSPGPSNPIGLTALATVAPAAAVLAGALLVCAAAAAAVTLAQRWSRARAGDRLAIAVVATPLVVAVALTVAAQAFGLGGNLAAGTAAVITAVGVPAAIWLAVTRYRLYRLDLAVTGTLGYALVATVLTGVYAATATLAGLVVGRDSRVAVAVATAVTAAAIAPLHGRIRLWVQRRVLGLAGDPERCAATVARRLATVEDPDRMADAAADAVAEVLRLPQALVRRPGEPDPPGESVCATLRHHGIVLGVVVVPGPLPSSSRQALTRIAEPIATALHAAALTDAVRRSRSALLAAVEEERRRLRRDLHDGLGPSLATLGMGLDAVGLRAAGTPAEDLVVPALARLRDQTDEMLADLRRVVVGLRPPALDQLGLVEAVRLQAAEVAQPGGLMVDVIADGDLATLPAAVEVAAYRIVVEAVLNVVRHSGAHNCQVALRRDDGLRLAVRDDGGGIPARDAAGVGLQSMRERAATVGGWVAVVPVLPRGTEVRAWLPAAL